jgi:hypothetical protein
LWVNDPKNQAIPENRATRRRVDDRYFFETIGGLESLLLQRILEVRALHVDTDQIAEYTPP